LVDVFGPGAEADSRIDAFLILCCLSFAIVAVFYSINERYVVTIISMICCAIFAAMFFASKGSFWRQ